MTIFYDKNGWRDLSDEGPGFLTYIEKEGYEIFQRPDQKHFDLRGPDNKLIASFLSLVNAKFFVDMLFQTDTHSKEDIKFLLHQIKRTTSFQDHGKIKQLMEKYDVSSE